MNAIVRWLAPATALLALALGTTRQARADLIVNGSFEQPGGAGVTLYGGSTYITGWTVTGDSIDYTDQSTWLASNGGYSLDLSGRAAGGIEQTFASVAGQAYQVSFDMAGNPYDGPAIKTMEVSAAGASQHFTFDTGVFTSFPIMDMGWTTMSFQFTATGSSTTLAFTSLVVNSPFGPALDNVRVTALSAVVPEPSTLAIAGLAGVCGIAYGLARKRRA
jgi:choice-of-anchor C domain-containing protein